MKQLILCLFIILLPLGVTADGGEADLVQKITAQLPELAGYNVSTVDTVGGDKIVVFSSPAGGSAAVTAKPDGVIVYYSEMQSSKTASGRLPNVSKTQAAQTALDFLNRTAADISAQLNTSVFTNTYSFAADGYNLRFVRTVNGIAYNSNAVSLFIDGASGRVTRFQRNWDDAVVFVPTDGIITQQQAQSAFEKNIGLELRYSRKISGGEAVIYPVYVPAGTSAIDARTGGAVLPAQRTALFENADSSVFSAGGASQNAVSAGVISEKTLISASEAQEYARSITELGIDDEFSAQQVRYYMSGGEYLVAISYEKEAFTASVTMNAKTLQIVSFDNSERAAKKSASILSGYAARAATESYLRSRLATLMYQLDTPVITASETEGGTVGVLYERIVNKISYKGNGIQFMLNADGEIFSLSLTWDNVSFDENAQLIGLKAAYVQFYTQIGLELVYSPAENGTSVPVYIVSPKKPAIISAESGRVLSYDGTPLRENRSLRYIGLAGHYAEPAAVALADCDIFVSQGDVLLDGSIRQQDFIALIAAILPEGTVAPDKAGGLTDDDIEMIYGSFVTKGIIDRGEINETGFVTRQDAVKYLIRAAGYGGVAELDGIFQSHFLDADQIPKALYGYVALARALKLVSGSDGYFHPKQSLTNADALVMVYNYLRR